MSIISRSHWRTTIPFTLIPLALIVSLVFAFSTKGLTHAAAAQTLTQISSDPYTNASSQHKTQVEPDTYTFGKTVVATFQSGRFYDGGSSNIGWATSHDGGVNWVHGFLPGITVYAGGRYDRASDPTVAYDAKHNVWMISYLAIVAGGNPIGPIHVDVLASRSIDGGLTWQRPVPVALSGPTSFYDKNWSVCDDTATSPFYGHCYTEWDDNGQGNLVLMSTSSDGAKTWGPPKTTADHASVIGGQPVVQPSGTVVVPIVVFKANFTIAYLGSFRSSNGGKSWSSTVKVASMITFIERAFVRNPDLPSAEVDGSGRVYVTWYDCRFEPNCSANDILFSTSRDGLSWSAAKRVPIDPIGSGIDHFTPGIGVDKSTGGSNARIGLTYYTFPDANCTTNTCVLDVGFISSTNGGATWSKKEQLAGPINLTWLALTTGGYMYGDYISTSIVPHGNAVDAFASAQQPTGEIHCATGNQVVCHEATYSAVEDVVGGNLPASSDPAVASKGSGSVARFGF